MASRNPKANPSAVPNPNRIQTRAKNVFTHPGRIVSEELRVRRRPEELEEEKRLRTERQQAQERKEAALRSAVLEVAEFENKMAADDAENQANFPRWKPKEKNPGPPEVVGQKRKGKSIVSLPVVSRKKNSSVSGTSSTKHDLTITENEDTETEGNVTEVDRRHEEREAKRSKTVGKPKEAFRIRPLVRTETYIVHSSSDIEMKNASNGDSEMEELDMMKAKTHPHSDDSDSNGDSEMEKDTTKAESDPHSDDSDFRTPKVLLRKALERRARFLIDDDMDVESEDAHESDTPRGANRTIRNAGTKNKKDRQAFRKEVEERRERLPSAQRSIVASQAVNSKSTTYGKRILTSSQVSKELSQGNSGLQVRGDSFKTPNRNSSSRVITNIARSQLGGDDGSGRSNKLKFINPKTAAYNKSKLSRAAKEPTQTQVMLPLLQKLQLSHYDAQKGPVSRTSATSGNGVGVGQTTAAKFSKQGAESKVESSTAMGFDFSDEDDNVERASIINSPYKGEKRLSSAAVVKVQKPKSCSRENILGREIISGWSKSIEPMFIYHYFYEMPPWPTAEDIAHCAQPIWDWRFSDKHPLALVESPQHLQLLNQKLCDVRSQAASVAIGILDHNFQVHNNITADSDLTQMEIKTLREQYANDCLDNKKFIFGKYKVSDNGKIRKSLPYQSQLISQTFAHTFKHIKDVNLGQDSPLTLLESSYPKTALAIATAVVERALTLCSTGDYDFVTGKLVPKPDPSHSNKRPSTNMFAFSETSWKHRVEFYLEKGISNLKDKDWETIMKAAAEYSTFVVLKSDSLASTHKALEPTEEELELKWDSGSDSESDD